MIFSFGTTSRFHLNLNLNLNPDLDQNLILEPDLEPDLDLPDWFDQASAAVGHGEHARTEEPVLMSSVRMEDEDKDTREGT